MHTAQTVTAATSEVRRAAGGLKLPAR